MQYIFCYYSVLLFLFVLCANAKPNNRIFFISDAQEPIWLETLYLKTERNKDATSALQADILQQDFAALFMLGDMVSTNAKSKWARIDSFIHKLQDKKIPVYATPGNHEYMMRKNSGRKSFINRFGYDATIGTVQNIDSVAVILLNSNIKKLTKTEQQQQIKWYIHTMDSLECDNSIQTIIVCTHHSPYTNSSVVSPSAEVLNRFIPKFQHTDKARLFLSGHSHNLEYFTKDDKNFVVIGGGGGLRQSLRTGNKQRHTDLLQPENKLRFFYLTVTRQENQLILDIRGFISGDKLDTVETKTIGTVNFND